MDRNISHATLIRYLTLATFIFLAVPYVIFFFGWLHWWLAIAMTVICVLPIVWEWKRPNPESKPEEAVGVSIMGWQIWIVAGAAFVLVIISGIGGWGYQNADWEKHNTLLRDLIEQPWPVMYQFDSVQLPLVYYFAYYLPAALIGKLFGWAAANHALLLESWLGLSLVFLWGVALIKRSWWKAALLVGGFAGMDILGYLLTAPAASMLMGEPTKFFNFEWWSFGWNYPSFDRVLFWTPNQGFAGWLVMSLILHEMLNGERKYAIWYLGLTTFWSPFITLGLLPFVIADWVSEPRTLPGLVRNYGLPNLCGVLLGGLIALLYASKFYPLPPEVSGKIVATFFFSLAQDSMEVIAGLTLLVLFWLLECGLYGILTWKLLDPDHKRSRWIVAVGLIVLGLLPFYQYGYYNDLLQKASVPALFALSILAGRAVLGQANKRGQRVALMALLAVGLVTSSINIGLQVEGIIKNGTLWHLPASSQVSTLWELQQKEEASAFAIEGLEYTSFISQYIGSCEAPFFQWFVKQRPAGALSFSKIKSIESESSQRPERSE